MSDAMHLVLAATSLLDVPHSDVEALVAARGWRTLRLYDRIVDSWNSTTCPLFRGAFRSRT